MKIYDRINQVIILALAVTLPWQTKLILSPSSSPYLEFALYGFQLVSLVYVIWRLIGGGLGDIYKSWRRYHWLYMCLAAFDLAVLVSLFPSVSIESFVFHYLALLLAELSAILLLLQSRLSFLPLALYFLIFLLPSSLFGIWQFMSQSSFASTWLGLAVHDPAVLGTSVIESGLRWLRTYGSFDHPNIFGGVNAIAAAMSVIVLSWRRHRFVYVLLPVFVLATILSFSRAAILSLVLFLVVFLLENFISGRRYIRAAFPAIAAATFTLALFVLATWPLLSQRADINNRLEQKSAVERNELLGQGMAMVSRHPVSGAGLGNYILALPNYDAHSLAPWQYQPVHNAFLLAWAETGVFGAVSLLAVLAVASVYLYKKKAVSLLIPWLFLMSFDHWFWSLPFGMLFCFVFWAVVIRDDFGTM
jgi:O-antigen ligase